MRENALQLLIFSLVTFPSTEFKVKTAIERVVAMVDDRRKRVRHSALDALAVLSQIYDSENILEVSKRFAADKPEGPEIHAAIKTRLSRKLLPTVSADGLVVYGLQISSNIHHSGPDVDWITAGSGSVSPGTGRTRGQLIAKSKIENNDQQQQQQQQQQQNSGDANSRTFFVSFCTSSFQDNNRQSHHPESRLRKNDRVTKSADSLKVSRLDLQDRARVDLYEKDKLQRPYATPTRSDRQQQQQQQQTSDNNSKIQRFKRSDDDLAAADRGSLLGSSSSGGGSTTTTTTTTGRGGTASSSVQIGNGNRSTQESRIPVYTRDRATAKFPAVIETSSSNAVQSTSTNPNAKMSQQQQQQHHRFKDNSKLEHSESNGLHVFTFNNYFHIVVKFTFMIFFTFSKDALQSQMTKMIFKYCLWPDATAAKEDSNNLTEISNGKTNGHHRRSNGITRVASAASRTASLADLGESFLGCCPCAFRSRKAIGCDDSATINNATSNGDSQRLEGRRACDGDATPIRARISPRFHDSDKEGLDGKSKEPSQADSGRTISVSRSTNHSNSSPQRNDDEDTRSNHSSSGGSCSGSVNNSARRVQKNRRSPSLAAHTESDESSSNAVNNNNDRHRADNNNHSDESTATTATIVEQPLASNHHHHRRESPGSDKAFDVISSTTPEVKDNKPPVHREHVINIEKTNDAPHEEQEKTTCPEEAVPPSTVSDSSLASTVQSVVDSDSNSSEMTSKPSMPAVECVFGSVEEEEEEEEEKFHQATDAKNIPPSTDSNVSVYSCESASPKLSSPKSQADQPEPVVQYPESDEASSEPPPVPIGFDGPLAERSGSSSEEEDDDDESESEEDDDEDDFEDEGEDEVDNVGFVPQSRQATPIDVPRRLAKVSPCKMRPDASCHRSRSVNGRPAHNETKQHHDSKPTKALQACFNQLENKDWEVTLKGLRALGQIARDEPEQLDACPPGLLARLLGKQIKNLRSQVARVACSTASLVFGAHVRGIEQDLDEIAAPLLHRTADTNRFLREDCNRALDAMVDHFPPQKTILTVANRGASHQNTVVHATTARLICLIVSEIGAENAMLLPREVRDKLFATNAKLLTDGNLQARFEKLKGKKVNRDLLKLPYTTQLVEEDYDDCVKYLFDFINENYKEMTTACYTYLIEKMHAAINTKINVCADEMQKHAETPKVLWFRAEEAYEAGDQKKADKLYAKVYKTIKI
ncbi:unnamed protein product [Trichogramma brassicae]|uniref:TOG domain-containing protein n=1 Tax=Trichogramma brassicae TaxID=86971 RepID=A0A6H5ILK2_9HYME|nr:unnamed protein product [Trichogramma brassicae]